MRGFNAAVRAAMMPKFVYRMRFTAFTVTQGADTALPLLLCDDDPTYDQLIDGTNPAEVAPGSRILALQLAFQWVANGGDNELVEWVLFKDPDGILVAAGAASIVTLFTQDVSTVSKIMRKNAIAAGHTIFDSNHATPTINVNIPRKTLRRIGPMQDGDTLRMTFTATAAAGNHTLYGRGRIITRQA